MASWDFASQLLSVASFSWSVHTSTQNDWRQFNNKDVKENPEIEKAEGSSPLSSNPADSSVSWVSHRPQRKLSLSRPSSQVQPTVSRVPSLPKSVPPPASTQEVPTDLWATEAPKELPLSDVKGPVVSIQIETPKLTLHLKEPGESQPPLENADAPGVSELVDPSENVPFPPSTPDGLTGLWSSNSQKLPFPSNPERPAVPWKVGRPKKFPPPPPVPESSVDNWLAPPKNQGSSPWLNTSEKDRSPPPSSEGDAVKWVVQPPKRELLSGPQSPAASWGSNIEGHEIDPFSSVDDFGEMPSEDIDSHSPFTPTPSLPEPDELDPLRGGLAQGTSSAYPKPPYSGGELSHHAAIYEHGNSVHKTEDDRYGPTYPYVPGRMPVGVSPPPPYSNRVVPSSFYLFLTGQLPHGTVAHSQTNYEAGGDYTTQLGYEKTVPQRKAPVSAN